MVEQTPRRACRGGNLPPATWGFQPVGVNGGTTRNVVHPLPLPMGEVAERSSDGEGLRSRYQITLSFKKRRKALSVLAAPSQLSQRESQGAGVVPFCPHRLYPTGGGRQIAAPTDTLVGGTVQPHRLYSKRPGRLVAAPTCATPLRPLFVQHFTPPRFPRGKLFV